MHKRDFDALYAQYSRFVYWTAFGVLREDARAQDTVQTVFLRVFENEKKLDTMEDSQLRAWLYRVTVNASRDVLRKERRQIPSEDVAVDISIDEAYLPENILVNEQTAEQVRNCVMELPPIYQEPILLYYFSGLDYHQIADVLNMSEGTLKSRMSRARGLLCKMLGKEEGAYERSIGSTVAASGAASE